MVYFDHLLKFDNHVRDSILLDFVIRVLLGFNTLWLYLHNLIGMNFPFNERATSFALDA